MTNLRTMTMAAILVSFAAVSPGQPQNPVVSPRGVINAYTQQPAPSQVAPGGVIQINGLNLGPAEEEKASASPLPTELGTPPVRVRINNRLAPLYSIGQNRIVAQMPLEIQPGLATVVVQRGQATSRPARITVTQPTPAVRTEADAGFGSANLRGSGANMMLAVTGLGPTDPAVATGEAASGPAAPRLLPKAYVGGLPAKVEANASAERPGDFDVQIEVPADAQPGDVITLSQQGRLSNFATLRTRAQAEVLFVPVAAEVPEFRVIQSAGLRGTYLGVTGARGADGCYPAWTFDMQKKASTAVSGCLTSAQAQAPTPFVAVNDGGSLAAFVGPPAGANQASNKVRLFAPSLTAPMDVTLPAVGQVLAGQNDGNYLAGGASGVVLIDGATGETRNAPPGALGGLPGGLGGGAGGGGGAAAALNIDLGGGFNKVLSPPVNVAQGSRVVLVGDNVDNPTKAKVAFINNQNEAQQQRDFPDGWLPVASPMQQLPAGQQLPPNFVRFSAVTLFDAPTRSYYVVARSADDSKHGLVTFRTDNQDVKAIELPSGWFVASCTPQIRIFGVESVRRVGLLGSRAADREFKNPCPANGFVLFDIDDQAISVVELPGAGQFGANQGTDELNDYIFGSNVDPARQGTADTLYILDGVTATPYRVDLPAGVVGFAQLRAVRDLSLLVGLGRARNANGDGGIVVFDLERASGSVLNVPDGFAAVQLLDVFPATRKIIARGIRTGNAGASILIYDLATSDVAVVPNPDNVAFVGQPPAAAPGPGGQPGGGAGGAGGPGQAPLIVLRTTPRAQTVEAVTYDANRRQNGVLVVRVN